MEKIKMPLATYVLYHSDYSDGEKAFDMIYQLLCRDIDRPLTDGIDIPVYLRTGKDGDNILSINYDESDKKNYHGKNVYFANQYIFMDQETVVTVA